MGTDVTGEPELLYQTSDPNETPLVMPMWARKVPILAALIDAGYELHRRGHEIAVERGITLDHICTLRSDQRPVRRTV